METLYELFRTLLRDTNLDFIRYLHDEIDWEARMFGILGARGVGKTTLLLQHIKKFHSTDDTLFVYADDIYFSENRLYDIASAFYKNGGRHLYIDEIHKYADWSKELKMMYDHFPKLQVVFTGSSILDLYKGSDDLSRRALLYVMFGLSFREYLNMSLGISLPAYSLEDILQNKVEFPTEINHPLPLFKQYLQNGYYPFFNEPGYHKRLLTILNIVLETDIPIYARMNVATSKKLKQLLYIIAQSVPFKPNFTKIGTMLDAHRGQVSDFIVYLEKAGIITQLRNHSKSIRELGKVEKVFLGNTNLMYALATENTNIGNIRETFFLSQMMVRNEITASPEADFIVNGNTFEVGGKNKQQQQIKEISNAFIVKDDIEFGYDKTLPLWAFGFNY